MCGVAYYASSSMAGLKIFKALTFSSSTFRRRMRSKLLYVAGTVISLLVAANAVNKVKEDESADCVEDVLAAQVKAREQKVGLNIQLNLEGNGYSYTLLLMNRFV